MYKAVVFDLDGTLLDTLDDLTDAVNYALAKYGMPVRTREEVCSFVGNGIVNLIQRAAGENHPEFDGILAEFRAYYKVHCADKTKPYEGILPLLKELKERGIKTAVLSNKADFSTQPLVEEYFHGLIDVAQGENEAAGVLRKPNPQGLLAIVKRLGVALADAVYVGDSDVDIKTSQNAGVACISVTWGFRDEEFLRDHGATKVVNVPLEILSEI